MRPSPLLPLPAPASERWVSERRISDQQYSVPPLRAYDIAGGGSVTIPGGERPPADLRRAP